MDITSFVVEGRDKALLYGDYSTYHAQCAKRLLNSRRKLGIASKNRGKYQKKDLATAADVAQNHEYVHLLLLTSERAWAQAMSYKATHAADQKGVVGRARSHIISRLEKAARYADHLANITADNEASGASSVDFLEARAYAAMIRGAMLFEKRAWESCLQNYATARTVYEALATTVKGDIFKDLLSETIDPSIRYAAYQKKTPRTVPIATIAKQNFPRSDDSLSTHLQKVAPGFLDKGEAKQEGAEAENIPQTLTWRSREVKIEDAQIAQAWGSVQAAKIKLAQKFSSLKSKDIAAAYEEILMATQDAVDATKQAIDELRADGVGQGDSRMQSLQITRTAVNYELISWRIGRNRAITGQHDGALETYGAARGRKSKAAAAQGRPELDLPAGKKLAKLKETVALYDATLQSLESIKELPGVAADETLASSIDSREKYFASLKSLAIARSHAIVGQMGNALALINHAYVTIREVTPDEIHDAGPLSIEVGSEHVDFLAKLLEGELQRHRAIVHIDNLRKEEGHPEGHATQTPLIERLHEYPAGGVDLKNIVEFPPKLALIPMKPVFLDVAWNYIDYPGRGAKPEPAKQPATAGAPSKQEPAQPAKKGWFGFGR